VTILTLQFLHLFHTVVTHRIAIIDQSPQFLPTPLHIFPNTLQFLGQVENSAISNFTLQPQVRLLPGVFDRYLFKLNQ